MGSEMCIRDRNKQVSSQRLALTDLLPKPVASISAALDSASEVYTVGMIGSHGQSELAAEFRSLLGSRAYSAFLYWRKADQLRQSRAKDVGPEWSKDRWTC